MMELLGSTLMKTLHEMAHGDTPDYLRLHPGDSTQHLHDGAHRLRRMDIGSGWSDEDFASFYAIVRSDFWRLSPLCESPIEREMLAILLTAPWGAPASMPTHILNKGEKPDGRFVSLQPQFEVGRSRLDFALFVARKSGGDKLIAVECDGKDYHDAKADADRDALLLSEFDIQTVRFTGSAIHTDPWRCSDEIVATVCEWAET